MITGITLGRKPGSKQWVLVSGPEVPIHSQNRTFRDLNKLATNPTWEELQVWEVQGKTYSRKFKQPISTEHAPVAAPATAKPQQKFK